jgi:hypothetical protein
MKLLYKLAYIILLLLVAFFFSCTKKDTPAPPKVVWQEFKGITNESKIILNATTDGEKLYCQGAYAVSIIDSGLKARSFIVGRDIYYDMLPAHPKFFITPAADKKSFGFYAYTMSDAGSAYVHVSETDPNLDCFEFTNQRKRYKVAINEEGQVLIPGRDKEGKYHFYLFTFRLGMSNTGVTIAARPLSVQKIAVPAMGTEPLEVHSIDNYFYALDYERSSLYKIDRAGTVTATITPNWGGELFKYGNALYQVHGTTISISTDGGNTFTPRYRAGDDIRSYFRVVNGKILVFHPYSGIGLCEFTPEGFTIKALDMEGLHGNHLTALAYFRGNLYAATLTGLYYKKWEDALK